MYPEEDIRTVRKWAWRRSQDDLRVSVDDDDVIVRILVEPGDPIAELRWLDDEAKWRLHTIDRGSMRPDPLTGPTDEVEQLLGCVGLDATERLLG